MPDRIGFSGRLALCLASWFGVGYIPFASGTWATAVALPLPLALAWLARGAACAQPGTWNPWPLVASALLFLPGVAAASALERITGEHDSHKTVVDEVVGAWLTLGLLPWAAFGHLGTYFAAFLLFRVLDVWKPGLIGLSQVLPRGWGVMVDDVLAGLLGMLILAAAWAWAPGLLAWGRLW